MELNERFPSKFLYAVFFVTLLIACFPIYQSTDLIFGHDTVFHLNRIKGMAEGLLTGNFPANVIGYVYNDYGYPVGYFYPGLFLYIPAVMVALGFDIVFSYHFFLFLMTISGAFIACYSFRAFFEEITNNDNAAKMYGYMAGAVYTGCYYRLIDIYVRTAVGEAVAMCFMPLALVSFYLMLKGKNRAWIGVVTGATGVLESHILSATMLFFAYIFLCVFMCRNLFNGEVLKSLLKATFFVILLNAWQYVPFINMYQSMDFTMKGFIQKASDIYLFTWEECLKYRFMTGYIPLIVILIYGVYRAVKRNLSQVDIVFYVCAFLCAILILSITKAVPVELLDKIPIIGENAGVLQFAYRFSMFTSVFMSIAVAIALCANRKLLFIICLIAVESLVYIGFVDDTRAENIMIMQRDSDIPIPEVINTTLKGTPADDVLLSSLHTPSNPSLFSLYYNDYLHKDITHDEYKHYTDDRSKECWDALQNNALVKLNPKEVNPSDIVKDFSREGLKLNIKTDAATDTELKLPLWYYPHSYKAECDGKPLAVYEVWHHRLAVTAPAGEHNIKIYPALHTPYKNALFISLAGFVGFIWLCFRNRRQRGKVRLPEP